MYCIDHTFKFFFNFATVLFNEAFKIVKKILILIIIIDYKLASRFNIIMYFISVNKSYTYGKQLTLTCGLTITKN